MSTTRFVLFGLVLFLTRVSSESHLTKCCPPGEIILGKSTIECVSIPRNAMELYVHHWNTTVGLFQGIPQCDEPEDLMTTPLDDLHPNNSLEVPVCLEILYEQVSEESTVIIVHCRSHKDRQMKAINAFFPQLAYIRKCCSRDTIFDSRTKSCIFRLNETESLITFLINGSADADLVVVAAESPPMCEGPIVDYEIDENDIFLRNGTYSVMVPAFKNIVKEELSITKDNACFEITSDSASDRTLIARVCRDPEYCDTNACIRKCCAENEFFYYERYNKLAVPNEITEFHEAFANAVNQTMSSAFDMTKDYGILIGRPCKFMYPLEFMYQREEKWLLTSKGHVSVNDITVYDQNKYCIDKFDHSFYLFICFDTFLPDWTKKINDLKSFLDWYRLINPLQIISCAFLLMTLLVYLCLLGLQKLHNKMLMCYVSSFFMAFICLLISVWITLDVATKEQSMTTCKAFAYTELFLTLSTFFWLNVICFDMWWTFGVSREDTSTKVREHRKRFLLYCLYAWGLSFLVSILAIVADNMDILPDYLQPEIGITSCWFTRRRDSYSEVIFHIGPAIILLISNVVFFILTSIHCNKIKAEIERVTDPMDSRNKRFHSDRKRFIMNVKLFIVMGMFWNWKVVIFFLIKYLDKKHLNNWFHVFIYINMVLNFLEGILIFSLFILKNRIYRKRLGLDTKKKKSNLMYN